MDQQALDARLRSGLRRSTILLGLGAILLIGVGGLLTVVGDGAIAPAGLVVIGMMPLCLAADAVVRTPRPAPRLVDGATVVPSSRLIGVCCTVLGLGVTLMVLGLVLGGSDWSDQRGAWVVPLLPFVAALLAGLGVLLLARPHRLVLTPERVEARAFGARVAAWDDVTEVGVSAHALAGSGRTALPLAITAESVEVPVQTRWTSPTLWVLADWVEHYRDHPADRVELGQPASIDRLSALAADRGPAPTWPSWFAPPKGAR